MKKIISLFAILATICTLFTSVASAAGTGRFYWEEKTNGTVKELTLYYDTASYVSNFSVSYDTSEAFAGGVTVTKTYENPILSTCNVADASAKQKVIAMNYTDVTAAKTGLFKLVTVEFDFANATVDSFTLPQKKAATSKDDSETAIAITNDAAGYTVTKPAPVDDKTDAVKGKEFHDGYQAYSAPEAFTIPADATSLDVVFEKTNADAKNDTIDLNTGVVGSGTTKLLPIITYKIGQNGVAAGDVFTLTIKNGATTVGAWTFTAE